MKISVVIPALNAGGELSKTLAALFQPAVDGLVREVILVDGGSSDQTKAIAEEAGARVLICEKGRGRQLAAGADAARSDWLLFLHADTGLTPDWAAEAQNFMAQFPEKAGVFRLRFNAPGLAPRLVEAGARARSRIFGMPYGDQGLLISRKTYDEIGGFSDMPLFEDVDLVDRLRKNKGRRALKTMRAAAVTSPARYERDGYLSRVMTNARCLFLYRAGVAPEKILAIYPGRAK